MRGKKAFLAVAAVVLIVSTAIAIPVASPESTLDPGYGDYTSSGDNTDSGWDTGDSSDSNDEGSTDTGWDTGDNSDSNDEGSTDSNWDTGDSSDTNDEGSTDSGWDTGDSSDSNDEGSTDGNDSPNAAISYSPQSPEAGQKVTFDGSDSSDSDGSIESYSWSGAFTASGKTVEHTFQSEGEYEATLTVTDNDGATASSTVTVNVEKDDTDPGGDNDDNTGNNGEGDSGDDGGEDGGDNADPTAEFSYTPSSPTAGETVNFDGSASEDSDGSITVYRWDFDEDGNYEKTGKIADYSFSSAGSHRVTLEVKDDDSALDTTTQRIDVSSTDGGDDDDESGDSGSDGGGSSDSDSGGLDVSQNQPSMQTSLSSDSVGYGETVTVTGSFSNIDSQRQVSIYFAGEKVAETSSTEGEFDAGFTAQKVGTHEVRVVSGLLEKSMALEVLSTVEITGVSSQEYLEIGETHEVCVNLDTPSEATVTLYQNGALQAEDSTSSITCFEQSAPNRPGSLEYRIVAETGSARDTAEKTIPVVEFTEEQRPQTPTGGFFSSTSNILLSTAAGLIVLLLLYYREKVRTYLAGLWS
jgi:PKD repeat protein